MAMPISPDQQLDPNKRRFGLPLDSVVGAGGPSPTEAANISKAGTPLSAASKEAAKGGSVSAGGSRGKAVAQSGGPAPVGYDGP